MIVVDTSVLVALGDRHDTHHQDVVALYRRDRARWVIPWAILPEVDYLLASRAGKRATAVLLKSVQDGAFQIEWGQDRDWERAAELNRRYADLALGLVDVSVMAIAERLNATAIATFDRRHFGAVKLRLDVALVP